jgi:hypothetical protein
MVPSGQSEVLIEEQAGFGRTARLFIAERFERRICAVVCLLI